MSQLVQQPKLNTEKNQESLDLPSRNIKITIATGNILKLCLLVVIRM